jgi:hypothetical protein
MSIEEFIAHYQRRRLSANCSERSTRNDLSRPRHFFALVAKQPPAIRAGDLETYTQIRCRDSAARERCVEELDAPNRATEGRTDSAPV